MIGKKKFIKLTEAESLERRKPSAQQYAKLIVAKQQVFNYYCVKKNKYTKKKSRFWFVREK